MSNNVKIAHIYCKKQLDILHDSGVWISDNLPQLSRQERKAILKVYKQYFKIVEYNPTTGVCRCTNGSTTETKPGADWFISKHEGGAFGQPVKAENLDSTIGSARKLVFGKVGDL